VKPQADMALRQEDIVDYLRGRKEHFRSAHHVRRIALIGSFARNEQRLDSDLDLLVDIEKDTPNIFSIKQALRAELEDRFHRKVEIASERYLKPYYREQIHREAIYVE
jgi:predicted nucleotidyltransferase